MILAKSKAGHDRNHIYVVIGEEAGLLLLANGTTKPLAKPKRKKPMHVQPIKQLPAAVEELAQQPLTDELLKKILREYDRRNENV